MGSQLIIQCAEDETRVAVVEHGLTTELYVEHRRDRGLVGNIYKGRVVRVLPGMQSAFVDIGLDRTAFLHVTDLVRSQKLFCALEGSDDSPSDGASNDEGPLVVLPEEEVRPTPIEALLREGQDLLVQIAKEPIGTKGARITTHISLPGRNVVLLPTVEHVGISRRIVAEEERARLKAIAAEIRPPEGGLIVRTVGEGKTAEDFCDDVRFLVDLWHDVCEREKSAGAPACIHRDLDLILRISRDLLTDGFDAVVIDSRTEHERLVEFVERFMPGYSGNIRLWEEEDALFDRYGVEMDLSRALERKVWLKSGGTIIIDETEALAAIDVNTGRYVGKANLEDTILKINLEAVKEIAYQLRLRNIGGIIIIDFIDMESQANRDRVYQTMVDALSADKARCNVLEMSELGLVEMTRKRVRESLRRTFTIPCFYCSGRGYLKSVAVICSELLSRVKKEAASASGKRIVTVVVHPDIGEALMDDRHAAVERLERRTGCNVIVRSREDFHLEQYEVYSR